MFLKYVFVFIFPFYPLSLTPKSRALKTNFYRWEFGDKDLKMELINHQVFTDHVSSLLASILAP